MITGAVNIISGLLSIAYVDSIIYHVFATIYCSDSALYQIYSRIGIIAYLWIIVLLTVIWIIPDGLMLYGIVKKKSSYLIPWLVMYIILLVVSIGIINFIIITLPLKVTFVIFSGRLSMKEGKWVSHISGI